MSKKITETKVMLTNVRLSYPHLFAPYGFEGNAEKYSASLLVDKDDTETVSAIESAVKAATLDGTARLWGGKKPANLKLPLRDGDAERPDDSAYTNMYFFNASSKSAPQVVGKYLDANTGKPVQLTEEDVYPGCYVNVTVNFYPFNVSGNKGVAAGLGNVQKEGDGEHLDGFSSAEKDFDFDEAPQASLDDDFLV